MAAGFDGGRKPSQTKVPKTASFTIFDILKEDQKKKFAFPKKYRRAVPREFWKKYEIYFNLKNTVWTIITKGKFPAKEKEGETTHALYVLDDAKYATKICPTTTRPQSDRPCWYIPKGKTLDIPEEVQQKDVYVLKDLSHSLPAEPVHGESDLWYGGMFDIKHLVEIN